MRRVIIKAVNNGDQEHVVKFNMHPTGAIKGVKAYSVAAESILAMNSVCSPEEVVVKETEPKVEKTEFAYTFKPTSVTAFEVAIK